MTVIDVKNRSFRAFTMPEVAVAVGVGAFGLVAVFSVLPFGIKAQRDNRDDTVIRYEGEYWAEALLGEGLGLADLSRVEMVQTYDGNTTTPSVFSYPNNSNNSPEKKTWAQDVCGWLSRPASDEQGNVISPHGNFALVKSFNGSLFDRKFGDANMAGDENRDLAFGYILEVVPEMIDGGKGCRLHLKFSWPLSEEDYIGIRSGAVTLKSRSGKLPRKKEWELRMPGKQIVPVLWRCDLNLRERLFMEKMSDRYFSGVSVKPTDLEDPQIFPRLEDKRDVVFQSLKEAFVNEFNEPINIIEGVNDSLGKLGGGFSSGDTGMYLINGELSYPISYVGKGNGKVSFGDVKEPSVEDLGTTGNKFSSQGNFKYNIAFLKYGEEGKDVLRLFAGEQAGRRYFDLNQPWRPLLINVDGEYYVSQPMFETFHRPAGAWEKGVNFVGNPDAPRMFMIRK
jgi:hypothetical protein